MPMIWRLFGYSVMIPTDMSYLLTLEGSLTTSQAEAVRDAVLDALRNHASVVIDCSGADAIDITFLQTLIAAARTAGDWRKDIRLVSPLPPLLLDALQRCGFPMPASTITSLSELFSIPLRAA
jgi:phospholipid transport system transporter-binding protein